jgi:hypothetical protein
VPPGRELCPPGVITQTQYARALPHYRRCTVHIILRRPLVIGPCPAHHLLFAPRVFSQYRELCSTSASVRSLRGDKLLNLIFPPVAGASMAFIILTFILFLAPRTTNICTIMLSAQTHNLSTHKSYLRLHHKCIIFLFTFGALENRGSGVILNILTFFINFNYN